MNTKKQKHGGRRKMFDPIPAVKKTIFVPANDVQLSMAVAKAAVKRRFAKLSAAQGKMMNWEFPTITLSPEAAAKVEANLTAKNERREAEQANYMMRKEAGHEG